MDGWVAGILAMGIAFQRACGSVPRTVATGHRSPGYLIGPRGPMEQQRITRVMGNAPCCPMGQP